MYQFLVFYKQTRCDFVKFLSIIEISYCMEIFFVIIPNKNQNTGNGEVWKKVQPKAFISIFKSLLLATRFFIRRSITAS